MESEGNILHLEFHAQLCLKKWNWFFAWMMFVVHEAIPDELKVSKLPLFCNHSIKCNELFNERNRQQETADPHSP